MLSLTEAIRALIISDKGPASDNVSVSADSSWGVNIVKLRFGEFFFILSEMASWKILSIPTVPQFLVECCKIWRGRTETGEKILSFENCLSYAIKCLWQRGQRDERRLLEGTLGSSDLQRSKSCPLTFVLCAASCLALIKLYKHPNHKAASAHINSTSFLSPILFAV